MRADQSFSPPGGLQNVSVNDTIPMSIGARYKVFNERLVGAGSPPFFAIREFMLGEAPAD